MFNFINVFPNIIINKVNYSEIKIPSHWKLTEYHEMDIKNIVMNFYKGFKKFYDDKTIIPYFNKNEDELKDLLLLVNYTNLHANIIKLNNDEVSSILDNKTMSQLFHFYFLFMIKNLFSLTDDRTLLSIEVEPSTEENIISTIDEINDEMHEITDLDIYKINFKT